MMINTYVHNENVGDLTDLIVTDNLLILVYITPRNYKVGESKRYRVETVSDSFTFWIPFSPEK